MRLGGKISARLNPLAIITGEKASKRATEQGLEMNREDIAKCKEHIDGALHILEREADTQPEVHLLIALREVMEDIEWLELHGEVSANVVRLSDARHLRVIAGTAAVD